MSRPGNYALVQWPVTQKSPSDGLQGVTLDDSGMAICAGRPGTCGSPDKPNDPIDITMTAIPGEPKRMALISPDQKEKAFLTIVPVPNEASDKDCHIQSVLLTPGAEAVAIEASGFEPNAEISIATSSGDEHHNGKSKAGPDGTYFTVLLPYRSGVQRGTTKVRLKSAACSPELSFNWGKVH
jgi:hypothetical protein